MKKLIARGVFLICIISASMLFAQIFTPSGTGNRTAGTPEEPIRVVLLNPGGNHWFWKLVIDFMQAAAEDLNMQLEVITSDWDHLLTIQQAKEVVARENPPHYIITGNEKSNAGEIIRIADQAGVKIFLFSNGFVDPEDQKKYGRPREKFLHWIGELIPNNYSAGYTMGKILINEAQKKKLRASDRKIHIAAIAGARLTHASEERLKGLRQVISEYSDTTRLLQVFHGDWTYERARVISRNLFDRYEDVQVVWAANDTMAMGAMVAATSLGKVPGGNILFGGCGWYAPALQKIQEGTLTTSVGGHFMEAGWAMVMIYDYHHGRDFISTPWKTSMYPITEYNIEKYLDIFGRQEWHKIDFRNFSKTYTPGLENYDFSLEAVIRQF